MIYDLLGGYSSCCNANCDSVSHSFHRPKQYWIKGKDHGMAVGTVATLYRQAGYCTVIPPTPHLLEFWPKSQHFHGSLSHIQPSSHFPYFSAISYSPPFFLHSYFPWPSAPFRKLPKLEIAEGVTTLGCAILGLRQCECLFTPKTGNSRSFNIGRSPQFISRISLCWVPLESYGQGESDSDGGVV